MSHRQSKLERAKDPIQKKIKEHKQLVEEVKQHTQKKAFSDQDLELSNRYLKKLLEIGLTGHVHWMFSFYMRNDAFCELLGETPTQAYLLLNCIEAHLQENEWHEAYDLFIKTIYNTKLDKIAIKHYDALNKKMHAKDPKKYPLINLFAFHLQPPKTLKDAENLYNQGIASLKDAKSMSNLFSKRQLSLAFNYAGFIPHINAMLDPEPYIRNFIDSAITLGKKHTAEQQEYAERILWLAIDFLITIESDALRYKFLEEIYHVLTDFYAAHASEKLNLEKCQMEFKKYHAANRINIKALTTKLKEMHKRFRTPPVTEDSLNAAQELYESLTQEFKDFTDHEPRHIVEALDICGNLAYQLGHLSLAELYYKRALKYCIEGAKQSRKPSFFGLAGTLIASHLIDINFSLRRYSDVIYLCEHLKIDIHFVSEEKQDAVFAKALKFSKDAFQALVSESLAIFYQPILLDTIPQAEVIKRFNEIIKFGKMLKIPLHELHLFQIMLAEYYWRISDYTNAKIALEAGIVSARILHWDLNWLRTQRGLASLLMAPMDLKLALEEFKTIEFKQPIPKDKAADTLRILFSTLENTDLPQYHIPILTKMIENILEVNVMDASYFEKLGQFYLKLARQSLVEKNMELAKRAAESAFKFLLIDEEKLEAADLIILATPKKEDKEPSTEDPDYEHTRHILTLFDSHANRLLHKENPSSDEIKQILKDVKETDRKRAKGSEKNRYLLTRNKLLKLRDEVIKKEEKASREAHKAKLAEQLKEKRAAKTQELFQLEKEIKSLNQTADTLLIKTLDLIKTEEKLTPEFLTEISRKEQEIAKLIAKLSPKKTAKKPKGILIELLKIQTTYQTLNEHIENYQLELLKKSIGVPLTELDIDDDKVDAVPLPATESEKKEAAEEGIQRFQDYFVKHLFPDSGKNAPTDYERKEKKPFTTEFEWVTALITELKAINVTLRIRSSVVALGVGAYLHPMYAKSDYAINDIDFFLEFENEKQFELIQTILSDFGFQKKDAGTNPHYKSFKTQRLTAKGECAIDFTCTSPSYKSTNLSILKRPELTILPSPVALDHLSLDTRVIPIDKNLSAVITKQFDLTPLFLEQFFETRIPDLNSIDDYADEYLKSFFQRTIKDWEWSKKAFNFVHLGPNARKALYNYDWIHEFFAKKYANIYLRESSFYEITDIIRAGFLEKAPLQLQAFLSVVISAHHREPLSSKLTQAMTQAMLPFFTALFSDYKTQEKAALHLRLHLAVRFLIKKSYQILGGAPVMFDRTEKEFEILWNQKFNLHTLAWPNPLHLAIQEHLYGTGLRTVSNSYGAFFNEAGNVQPGLTSPVAGKKPRATKK